MKITNKNQLKEHLKKMSLEGEGELVLCWVNGKLVISSRPTRRRLRPTEKQLATQIRFKKASAYATAALASPSLRAQYEQGVKGKLHNARLVAISDYLNAPVIHDIDVSEYEGKVGNAIIIKATDDFVVRRVQVTILSGGVIIETGDAVHKLYDSRLWDYKATVAGPPSSITLRITAFDMAGNKTTKRKILVLKEK